MRRLWLLLAAASQLCCQVELSQPDLKKPLRLLPSDACMVLVASDLANTWQRVEQYQALQTIRRLFPQESAFDNSNFVRFLQRAREFEEATGYSVADDLILNLLGQRLVAGLYASDDGAEILVGAEVQDPRRLAKAFQALRDYGEGTLKFEDLEVAGRKAIRIHEGGDLDFTFAMDGKIFVASTRAAMIESAFDVHASASLISATEHPQFLEAMRHLGLQSVAVVGLGDESRRIPWAAQGMTWDDEGVHFQRLVKDTERKDPRIPVETEDLKSDILKSVPAGVMLTYYAKPEDALAFKQLFTNMGALGDCVMQAVPRNRPEGRKAFRSSRDLFQRAYFESDPESFVLAAAPSSERDFPLGMSELPFNLEKDVQPWIGDEGAFVFSELMQSPLGPVVPGIGFILETIDPDRAERTLHDLESSFAGLPIDLADGFVDVRYGGKTFRSFSEPRIKAISPSYLVDGDIVILTSTRLLMQQIIDTRRNGKGDLLSDAVFRPFDPFVPDESAAVLYVDHRRLQRAMRQVSSYVRMFGERWAQAMEVLDEMNVILDHFPASTMYLERTEELLVVRGWMQETN